MCGLLEGRSLSDAAFDRLYPEWARELSELHWTPVAVARRAVELLAEAPSARVLDVGSGVGKVCLIGALTTRATFVGVEQRKNLVEVSAEVAVRCGATRARFLHANMLDLDWSSYDAFYLYNPFYEHIYGFEQAIPEPIELLPERFAQYVRATYMKLVAARAGTRVVVFNGYGGPMPLGYRLCHKEPAGGHHLEVWVKGSAPRSRYVRAAGRFEEE